MKVDNSPICPAFFVLGVQKSGTSTLHNWLNQNPNISLPTLKETHFFSDESHFQKGLTWYNSWFSNNQSKIRVEIDPSYIFVKESAERLSKTVYPAPSFIIIFRDPLTRAYSHYRMSVQRGIESLQFTDALLAEKKRLEHDRDTFSFLNHSYLTRGNYSKQLQHFQRIFPDSNFLFLKFDELFESASRRDMYSKVCDFLSVPADIHNVNLDIISRPASTSKFTWLSRLMHRNSKLKEVIGKLVPSYKFRANLFNFIDESNKTPAKGKTLFNKSKLPQDILDWANHEIEILSGLTKLELTDWLN